MSLLICLTTDDSPLKPSQDCRLWVGMPVLGADGIWQSETASSLFVRELMESKLAALGFPPPGEIRVVEIGPYEEDKQ